MISYQEDKPSTLSDLFKLDAKEFQQIFDQNPLENENLWCTTYDVISETINIYNNDLLISKPIDFRKVYGILQISKRTTINITG